jgi:hypothetical protein
MQTDKSLEKAQLQGWKLEILKKLKMARGQGGGLSPLCGSRATPWWGDKGGEAPRSSLVLAIFIANEKCLRGYLQSKV